MLWRFVYGANTIGRVRLVYAKVYLPVFICVPSRIRIEFVHELELRATQLSLAVAAILTADRMRHEAQRMRLMIQALSTPEGRAERRQSWLNPWCEPAVMQCLPLIWGVL